MERLGASLFAQVNLLALLKLIEKNSNCLASIVRLKVRARSSQGNGLDATLCNSVEPDDEFEPSACGVVVIVIVAVVLGAHCAVVPSWLRESAHHARRQGDELSSKTCKGSMGAQSCALACGVQ